jgi:hypothetical protein
VCRAWNDNVSWQDWSKAFKMFPQQEKFPRVLVPIMVCARKGEGGVERMSAMEHLKLSTQTLKTLRHATISLGDGRSKYVYKIEDLFCTATDKYGTTAKLESHIARCQKAAATRDKNRLLKEERRVEVVTLLHEIGVDHLISYDDNIKAYIHKGRGSINAIRNTALECKRAMDQDLADALTIHTRRMSVDGWALDVHCNRGLLGRNPTVLAYIYKNLGNADTVMQACLEEKEALKIRRRQFLESPAYGARRRAELQEELLSKDMSLQEDSGFFRQIVSGETNAFIEEYISGETNASIEEVVATIKVSNYILLIYMDAFCLQSHNTIVNQMKRMVQTGEATGWYDASDRVIRGRLLLWGDDLDSDVEEY